MSKFTQKHVGKEVIGNGINKYTFTCKGWRGVIKKVHSNTGELDLVEINATQKSTLFTNLVGEWFDLISDEMKKNKKEKQTYLEKELDNLILPKDSKDEIMAVIRQQKNNNKLFKDWGLDETIEYGKGMTFLFHGPPGTGKTWGAKCIAKVVGKEILSIGQAEIQSSEPGAASRNIQGAFKSAKETGNVLLLDECDSLICARGDVGMILAGEINTLLTEIEKFEGILVLATNRIEHLDEALERRISLILEFKEPNYEQREGIWGRIIPKKLPLHKSVNIKKLSEFNLTGGQIKNVLLGAARLAASEEADKVGLIHFESAIERVRKSKSLMGSKSRWDQRCREDFVEAVDKARELKQHDSH